MQAAISIIVIFSGFKTLPNDRHQPQYVTEI
jgi:hypothetical protein